MNRPGNEVVPAAVPSKHHFVSAGPDVVVWNLHRRYGNLRLPLLLAGWERVENAGWDEQLVRKEAPYTRTYEPVFVLRRPAELE